MTLLFPGAFICYLGQQWLLEEAFFIPFPSPGRGGGGAGALLGLCPLVNRHWAGHMGIHLCRLPDRYLSLDEVRYVGAVP